MYPKTRSKKDTIVVVIAGETKTVPTWLDPPRARTFPKCHILAILTTLVIVALFIIAAYCAWLFFAHPVFTVTNKIVGDGLEREHTNKSSGFNKTNVDAFNENDYIVHNIIPVANHGSSSTDDVIFSDGFSSSSGDSSSSSASSESDESSILVRTQGQVTDVIPKKDPVAFVEDHWGAIVSSDTSEHEPPSSSRSEDSESSSSSRSADSEFSDFSSMGSLSSSFRDSQQVASPPGWNPSEYESSGDGPTWIRLSSEDYGDSETPWVRQEVSSESSGDYDDSYDDSNDVISFSSSDVYDGSGFGPNEKQINEFLRLPERTVLVLDSDWPSGAIERSAVQELPGRTLSGELVQTAEMRGVIDWQWFQWSKTKEFDHFINAQVKPSDTTKTFLTLVTKDYTNNLLGVFMYDAQAHCYFSPLPSFMADRRERYEGSGSDTFTFDDDSETTDDTVMQGVKTSLFLLEIKGVADVTTIHKYRAIIESWSNLAGFTCTNIFLSSAELI